MKLKQFTVREFKSIWDSGPIEIDDLVTCLVGKNEAGKTALLTALYRTNPIIPEDGGFDLTYDYPKREVEDYRFAVENRERPEAVVVDCLYELDAEDKAAVAKIFGVDVLKSNTFRRETYYGKRNFRSGMADLGSCRRGGGFSVLFSLKRIQNQGFGLVDKAGLSEHDEVETKA